MREMPLQKLVICFDEGGDDYECPSCPCVVCVEYESPEAFAVHFEEQVLKLVKANEEFEKALQPIQKEMRTLANSLVKSKKAKTKEQYEAKWDEWKDKRLKLTQPDDRFGFCNYKWDYHEFWDFEHKKYYPPDIYTIGEWFEKNLNREIV